MGFVPPSGPSISIDQYSNTPTSSSNTNAEDGKLGDQGSTSRTASRHGTDSRNEATPVQAESPISSSHLSTPHPQEITAE